MSGKISKMSEQPAHDQSEVDDGTAAIHSPGGIVERAIRRVSDRRDVAVWEGVPVELGPELAYLRDTGSLHMEKLRSLRTELRIRLGTQRGNGALAILGSQPGEGRSHLAAGLALVFAQLGGKTLLVDANLRKPGLNRLFRGALPDQGLTEVLLGKTNTPSMYRVVGPPHLALLCAGTPASSPVDLLSGHRFDQLIREWSRSYDQIVIDTPSTKSGSDGIVVANAVLNVLLVARQHKTSYAALAELKRRLGSSEARIVGAVLNEF